MMLRPDELALAITGVPYPVLEEEPRLNAPGEDEFDPEIFSDIAKKLGLEKRAAELPAQAAFWPAAGGEGCAEAAERSATSALSAAPAAGQKLPRRNFRP